jgi:hypothetical protein
VIAGIDKDHIPSFEVAREKTVFQQDVFLQDFMPALHCPAVTVFGTAPSLSQPSTQVSIMVVTKSQTGARYARDVRICAVLRVFEHQGSLKRRRR